MVPPRALPAAFALLALQLLCCAPLRLAQSDADTLLAFKATFTNGDEKLASWVPGTDPCTWVGVANCRDGIVYAL